MSEATVTPGAAKVRQYSSARWILGLLFVGNLLNFYDRQLPAIVLEQIKAEFRLDDAQAGLLAYAGYNFAAYAIGTFLTPVLQRYYGLALVPAAILSGVVIGVTGLIGLLIGGRLLDRAATRSAAARARISGITLAAAAVLSGIGLAAGQGALWQLVVFLGLGYLCGIIYLAASTPTISDIVPARQRSTAMGVAFAIALLLGGAGGPIVVGAISDSMNKAASSTLSADAAAAQGLQQAMLVAVPVAFALAAVGMFLASRTMNAERQRMLAAEAGA